MRTLVLAGLLAAAPAQAATYDPDLTWRTITTDHFHIHFHQGEEQLAEEFSTTVEDVHDTMTEELRWKPRRRTHVVLIDRTDAANGFAGSVPYNAITIFVTGPDGSSTLGDYEDWLTAIQTHEYTHTLHIDTNHGIVRAARYVVGRIASTNRLSPGWVVEGLATFQETRNSNGGRGRTGLVEMMLRTAALEGAMPRLGQMDGYQARLPAGNLRYLFGRDFIQFIADRHGEDVWTKWVHAYGSGIPYLLPGKRVFGEPLHRLHGRWLLHRKALADQTVARLREDGPLTEGRTISEPDKSCSAPTFSPDGEKLLFSCWDPREGSQIWMADGAGESPHKLLQDRGASSFTWRTDSQAFVYAGTHVVNRFNQWSDIYLHELGDEGVRALTSGARARDPDFSPDGSHLLVVTNQVQDNQLEVLTVDKRQEPLTRFRDHTQLEAPRYSPDGRFIAVSQWQDGRRDLWLYPTDGSPSRRLTRDDAIDRDPRWSADGRTLYFASDRSGIPQVYAIDLDAEHLWQVTNVATGAVAPAPHPTDPRLAWQEYHNNGWRIVVHDLDREAWIDRGLLPRTLRRGPGLDTEHGSIAEAVQQAPDNGAADMAGPATAAALTAAPRRQGVPVDPVTADLPGAPRPSWMRLRGALPDEAFPQDAGGIDSFDQANVEGVFGEEEDYPFTIEPRRYTPLGPLMPRYWVPFVQTTPFPSRKPLEQVPFGLFASASTGSVDPVRHYAWGAGANFRTDANFVGGAASFTLNRWIPVYNLSVSRRADTPAAFILVDPDDPVGPDGEPNLVRGDRYWQKMHTISASVNYPYTYKTWIFARYALAFRDDLDEIPDEALPEYLPLRGALGTLQGGWRYAWNQQTSTSISTEDGRIVSVVGGLVHPLLGAYALDENDDRTGLTAVQLTAELREYRVLPGLPNHVLAMRAAAGATFGQDSFLGLYQLGGSFGDSAFYVTPASSRMVRGYPFGTDVGDLFWLAGAEYRFPITRFDSGILTWPVFFRALSGNVFVDAGNAFSEPTGPMDAVDGTLVGVGAEVRLQMVLWYGVGTSVRVGFATGLTTEDAITPLREGAPDPRVFYARLGSSF